MSALERPWSCLPPFKAEKSRWRRGLGVRCSSEWASHGQCVWRDLEEGVGSFEKGVEICNSFHLDPVLVSF